jgi:hypothetical protein
VPAATGDRVLRGRIYSHAYKRSARDRAAGLYVHQHTGYVWVPDFLGLDMTAPWVRFVDKPLTPYWTTGDVRFRDSWTGQPADEAAVLQLHAGYRAGTADYAERLALTELYALTPDGYRRIRPGEMDL